MEEEQLLFEASRKGDTKQVARLLKETKIHPDGYKGYDGRTSLMAASRKGNLDIVKMLVEAGASLELRTEDGSTPLHNAVASGQVDVVKLLLLSGADSNAQTIDKVTPLILACYHGYLSIVKELLKFSASVTMEDEWGTPLDTAKRKGHIDLVHYLENLNKNKNKSLVTRAHL